MNMYELFELTKVLSLVKPNGHTGVIIQLSSYSECNGRSILALVCNNGYLLFYYLIGSKNEPVIRQLNWFCGPDKEIKALSFDPSGTWVLLVTHDASVYILPILPLLDPTVGCPNHWKTDNITEIRLTGQRAPLTSVRWWLTLQGQHIAIVGSELGEIAFVNLINKKEVGGTYINVGIFALDILKDETNETTYLLITGNNRQQWRLLLEEKKSNFYWPFNSEIEVISCDRGNELPVSEKEEKDGEQKPHKLSKFESGTFLTPQSGVKRNLVSAYNASSNVLQVLEGDLNQMHLFSYQVPADCENIILSDKLIFITQTNCMQNDPQRSCLRLLSRKFAEICMENSKKKEHQNSEIQAFYLNDKVSAIYKRSFECCKCANFRNSSSITLLKSSAVEVKASTDRTYFPTLTNPYSSKQVCENSSNSYSICESHGDQAEGSVCEKFFGIDFLSNVTSLDGCYLIFKDSVWECRLRQPPEILFLSLTSVPTDLPIAETIGVMLGLEIHKLYEIAAEIQLSHGQFAQAVHLYQLSKCPQLKRIAHFMSYGYLSELIAYIQVLFSTKSVEIVSADKCHFANIALHCFAQQAMEKINEWCAISNAFKKFLRDNVYYDEAVAIKLFSKQGLFDLLYYFSKVRGQLGLIIDTLLQTDGLREAIDANAFEALVYSGFNNLTSHLHYEDYLLCMTSSNLLQYLAANPCLLSQHMQHLIELLPNMNTYQLTKVASLFDLSRGLTKLAIQNISATKRRYRYWSTGSVTSIASNKTDLVKNGKEIANEEDLVKFFIFVLLMLCRNSKNHFDVKLITFGLEKANAKITLSATHSDAFKSTSCLPIACGLAHSAYCKNGVLFTWGKTANGRLGNGDVSEEFQAPSPVNFLLQLQVKVLSVSCGATHTMALTDYGVFSWGSSRYGQLGLGDIQRAAHPTAIENLMNHCIISVQCGQYHSLALTKKGRVYSWGWGVHGQLGHGNPEDINEPKIITFMKSKVVISLGAGQGHSALLTKNGEVFTFGCGMFGQLGVGSVSKQSLPQLVILPEFVKLMSSGYFHCVAIGETNKIYTWGCNPQALRLQAQCSRKARQNTSTQNQGASISNAPTDPNSTTKISQPNNLIQSHLLPNTVDCGNISSISQISCGSHHTILVTSNGEIFAWGRNMDGQIGNGSRREQKSPSRVIHLNDHKIVSASCGADFTIVLDSSGIIFGWGKNDCGQIGQKPEDSSSKAISGSSSGRVITIRTNRRMITITQPCRQSLLRPVKITLPFVENQTGEIDSGNFENEYSSSTMYQHLVYTGSVPELKDLSSYDNPSYGPFALHATLKAFHANCDFTVLLKHCHSFTNYQAAAKLCILQNHYAEALEYQLMAITNDPVVEKQEYSSLALYVIEFYSNFVEADNTEYNTRFLSHIIKFWIEYGLLVQPLESLFQKNFHLFSYALSCLLFSSEPSTIEEKFLSHLSNQFCINIIIFVISKIQNGSPHFELLEKMKIGDPSCFCYGSDTLAAWNSVPSERLWQEILHNIYKSISNHNSLCLRTNDVDVLAKTLIAERLCNNQSYVSSNLKDQKILESSNDTILFSCNHFYTLQTFRNIVVPTFKESILKLPLYMASTLNYLLTCYHLEGFIPSACPNCVLNEIKNEI